MDISTPTLKRAGTTASYMLLGVVGTGVIAFGLLPVTQPVQRVIYHVVYLQIGPSEATQTAILTQVVGISVLAISIPMLLADYLSTRLKHRAAFAKVIVAMLVLVLVFLAISLAQLAAFLTALGVMVVAFVGIPLALRYRYRVRSGGVPAFVGGIPVLILLLLLTGFGLGWGWGYVLTAQEVPASSVNGTATADINNVPEIRDELFAPENCQENSSGQTVCHLFLRGNDHEVAATRFLAQHGARCPYQNTRTTDSTDSVIVRHDGAYYRLSCAPHGD